MATARELLESYQGGARQAGSDVNFLLRKLRRDMQLARQEDEQLKKNIKSGGKTALNTLKTRREFLLAQRFNPDLTFKEFLLDPRTAGEYMQQGAEKIISGEATPLTLRETFGLKPKKVNNLTNQPIEKISQQSEESVSAAPKANLSPQKEVFDFSNVPEDVINKYKADFANSPEKLGWQRALNDAIISDMVPTKNSAGLVGPGKTFRYTPSTDTLDKAGMTLSESADNVSALGTAGNVLGTVGGLVNLGSGLSNIAKGRGDLSNVSGAASGAASLASAAGLANPLLGVGLGLLSLLSKRRR